MRCFARSEIKFTESFNRMPDRLSALDEHLFVKAVLIMHCLDNSVFTLGASAQADALFQLLVFLESF